MASQILINGTPVFTEALYPIDIEPSILSKKMNISGITRNTIRLTIEANIIDAVNAFVNNISWGIREFDLNPETGEQLDTYTDYDYSEYCIASDIVDHRDGTCTVYMAMKTEDELKIEALEADAQALQILMGGIN